MKKTKSITSFLILLFLLVNSMVYSQVSSKEVDLLVKKAMKEFNVAGVAVAIVKDGKIIHKKGYGVKSVDSKQPVNEFTNFQIASNSKAFTTAALSILVDEKKLSWKDKVTTYLPEFKMYNAYVTENFLIEDLLCHRSGLGLGAGDLMAFPDGADFTVKDVLTNFQYFEPVSDFRTQYDYDNQLYIIAGELIARVSGIPWGQFVQTRIMEPLHMTNSFSSLGAIKDRSNVATPHKRETGKLKTISFYDDQLIGAAGSILSNVNDMSKWMLVQLNKGKYGDSLEKRLFTEARQKEMWQIHTVTRLSLDSRYNQHFSGYGLGWRLADIKGNLSVSHTGGLAGMLSIVTMIPDIKLGIVILTNTEGGGSATVRAVSQTIIDSYLGLDDFNWIEKIGNNAESSKSNEDAILLNVWKTVEAAKNRSVKYDDFIGIYEDRWFGKIEVFLKENQLWFRSFRSPKLNGPMQLYKANTFAIKWDNPDLNCDAFAMFGLDEEGKAQSIKMKGISPNIDFSYDFQDLHLQRVKE